VLIKSFHPVDVTNMGANTSGNVNVSTILMENVSAEDVSDPTDDASEDKQPHCKQSAIPRPFKPYNATDESNKSTKLLSNYTSNVLPSQTMIDIELYDLSYARGAAESSNAEDDEEYLKERVDSGLTTIDSTTSEEWTFITKKITLTAGRCVCTYIVHLHGDHCTDKHPPTGRNHP